MNRVPTRDVDDILREIVAGTASVIGEAFFREVVQHLAQALGVRWAFVAEFASGRSRVRTLAFWAGDRLLDNIEFELAGTPCEDVLAGHTRLHSRSVAELFPREGALAAMGAESYLAMPLLDLQGEVMGHLAIIDDKPLFGEPRELAVFEVFVSRVAAELERRNTHLALRRSKARLNAILHSATDVIVTMDGQRRITMFNQSAEKVFGCSAPWAIGQPFDRFLSKPFRHLMERYLGEPSAGGGAAALLGLAPSTLRSKMNRLGIRRTG